MPSTRILIIEDYPPFLDLVVKLLERHFAIVGTLPDGESGLAQAVGVNPDIIILDISLPDITGFEVAERLRVAGCRAKIVFLSSDENPETVRASFEVGASGYVFKSCMVPDLITAIEAALNDAVFVPTTPTYTSSCPNLASLEDQLRAKIVRLQTQRENIVFALTQVDVSDEQRAHLHAQLSSVEDELVLTGGMSGMI
jgi:DNA-binding NarL/FixJ family response regulator